MNEQRWFRLVSEARALFRTELHEHRLLPIFPSAARRLTRASRARLTEPIAARVLTSDPLLTAQLFRASNTAFFRNAAPCKTVEETVRRLGRDGLNRVILTATKHAPMDLGAESELEESACARSRAVAITARTLAELTEEDGDTAYVCGLLHDVGRLVAFGLWSVMKEELPVELRTDEAGRRMVDTLHCSVGREAAVAWGLPKELEAAMAQHHRPRATARDTGMACLVAAALRICDALRIYPEAPVLDLRSDRHVQRLKLPSPLVNQAVLRLRSEWRGAERRLRTDLAA